MEPTRVVILGGGVAGVTAARHLMRLPHFSILLIEEESHHRSAAWPDDLCLPLTRLAPAVEIRLGGVRQFDMSRRSIELLSGETVPYDQLVLALDRQPVTPPGKHAYPDVTLAATPAGRRQFLDGLARTADRLIIDPAARGSVLVVGSGRSGRRTATIAGRLRRVLQSLGYLRRGQLVIKMFDSAREVAPHEDLAFRSQWDRERRQLGIDFFGGTAVAASQLADWTAMTDPRQYPLIVWAAGRSGGQIAPAGFVHYATPGGQIATTARLSLPGSDHIWVAGDRGTPANSLSVAGAEHQGRIVAENIRRLLAGAPFLVYEPLSPVRRRAASVSYLARTAPASAVLQSVTGDICPACRRERASWSPVRQVVHRLESPRSLG